MLWGPTQTIRSIPRMSPSWWRCSVEEVKSLSRSFHGWTKTLKPGSRRIPCGSLRTLRPSWNKMLNAFALSKDRLLYGTLPRTISLHKTSSISFPKNTTTYWQGGRQRYLGIQNEADSPQQTHNTLEALRSSSTRMGWQNNSTSPPTIEHRNQIFSSNTLQGPLRPG